MRINKVVVLCTLLILALNLTRAEAGPLPALDLEVLTNEANQIVVGQVVAVWEIEPTTVEMHGQSIRAIRMGARLRGDRVIKGQSDQPVLHFEFLVTDFSSYARILPKQYGMFFLRLKAPQQYLVSNPYYPFIVASPNPLVSEGSVFDKVVAEVAHVLRLNVSRAERSQAIEALKNVRLESATLALRRAASDPDTSLRLQAIAALLWRNDISSLDTAVSVLLNPSPSAERQLLANLAASVEGIKDPRAIPLLTNLIAARDTLTRRAAASALRHTAATSALKPLSTALKDPDREVRYQAVIGLAEITGQYEWGPSIELFQRDEQRYLAHWREWAKTR